MIIMIIYYNYFEYVTTIIGYKQTHTQDKTKYACNFLYLLITSYCFEFEVISLLIMSHSVSDLAALSVFSQPPARGFCRI